MKMMKCYLIDEDSQNGHLGEIPKHARGKIHEFCTKSLFVHGHKLFECFSSGMTLLKRTTGANKGKHRGLKKHTSGPTPQDTLHESCSKINHIHEQQENIKDKKTARYDN